MRISAFNKWLENYLNKEIKCKVVYYAILLFKFIPLIITYKIYKQYGVVLVNLSIIPINNYFV